MTSNSEVQTNILRIGRVVSFANSDIELTRGASEPRRRYLDFLGAQIDPRLSADLRAYERALRARNALLKSPQPRPREIAAYDQPLVENGRQLIGYSCGAGRATRSVCERGPFADQQKR